MAVKKLIDITRLTEYDNYLKTKTIKDAEDRVNAKIGTVPSKIGEGGDEQDVADLVDYVNKLVALVNSDSSALADRVDDNEGAIDILNGASNVSGSVANTVAVEIAKIVNENNNGTIDTLNEIAAWIINGSEGALAMQNDIKFLQGTDGTTHTKTSASIPGVKLYIDDLVDNKNVTAGVAAGELLLSASDTSASKGNSVSVASTQKLKDAVERAEGAVLSVKKAATGNVENYVSLTVVDGDDATVALSDAILAAKITSMYSDMQGSTTETVASVEAKVDELTVAPASDIKALFGITE